MSERGLMPADEAVLLRTRPGAPFILLYRQGWWLWPPVLMLVLHAAAAKVVDPARVEFLTMLALVWLVGGLLYRIAAWLCRSYVLTDRRMLVVKGVFSRAAGDVPLRNIQNATVTQSLLERLLGLGTIGVSTAGSDGAAINWLMVPGPYQVLEKIREAIKSGQAAGDAVVVGAGKGGRHEAVMVAPAPTKVSTQRKQEAQAAKIPVIGLAGGIGSGKSEAARVLAELGCLVVDSDKEAKAALDEPDVRKELVRWWGGRILGADGRVNRKAVADIIFSDAAERARLEGLVHPLVKAGRADVRERALRAGAKGVVIDAPLLFEAGVDAECDAVIFIDAPREARLRRVRHTRGWDEAELSRRETSQLSLEEKRRRSHHVILNDDSPDVLRRGVAGTFQEILTRFRGDSGGRRVAEG